MTEVIGLGVIFLGFPQIVSDFSKPAENQQEKS